MLEVHGQNPLEVRRADGTAEVARKDFTVLVRDGDELRLVVEEVCPAKDASLRWAGTSCAYRLQIE